MLRASIFLSLTGIPLIASLHLPNLYRYDDDTPLPVIIWHGLGDSANGEGMQWVKDLAESTNEGTFAHIIQVGSDDSRASWVGNLTEQIDKVCADLAAHPILSTAPAVDALGFSQGGQFLRGYIERCNFPPVRSLVTFGSQHNGIAKIQECADGIAGALCRSVRGILWFGMWSKLVQGGLIPAQYFRDPEDLDNYLQYSNFLADINNERALKNQTYKKNLMNLEKFVMYVFEKDETVHPKESGWFYEVEDDKVTKLKDRPIYTEDWLGLKALDSKGALEFRTVKNATHMRILDEDLVDVFKSYFGPIASSQVREEL